MTLEFVFDSIDTQFISWKYKVRDKCGKSHFMTVYCNECEQVACLTCDGGITQVFSLNAIKCDHKRN
jgi:ribosomal protein S27E